MKNLRISLFAFVLLSLAATSLQAQFDDLYFDPDTDKDFYSNAVVVNDQPATASRNESVASDFDEDDYGYYYSSRIRRYDRSYRGFDYYSPAYTDAFYYDPFLTPGMSIYAVNNSFFYRPRVNTVWVTTPVYGGGFVVTPVTTFNRWNRGFGFNSWNRGFGNPWGNPWGPGAGFGSPWGAGPGFGGGFAAVGGGYYCPPAYNSPRTYTTTTTGTRAINNGNTYNGSRYGTTSTGTRTTSTPRRQTTRITNRSINGENGGNTAAARRTRPTTTSRKTVKPSTASSRSASTRSASRATNSGSKSRKSLFNRPSRSSSRTSATRSSSRPSRSSSFGNSRSSSRSKSFSTPSRSSSRSSGFKSSSSRSSSGFRSSSRSSSRSSGSRSRGRN